MGALSSREAQILVQDVSRAWLTKACPSKRYLVSPSVTSYLVQDSFATSIQLSEARLLPKWLCLARGAVHPVQGSRNFTDAELLAALQGRKGLDYKQKLVLKRINEELAKQTKTQTEKVLLKRLKATARMNFVLEVLLWLVKKSFWHEKASVLERTSDIRMSPLGRTRTEEGLVHAHILSLSLSKELWAIYRPNSTISSDELAALRGTLNSPTNLRTVCQHTNQVLHVQYDKEIGAAITREACPH